MRFDGAVTRLLGTITGMKQDVRGDHGLRTRQSQPHGRSISVALESALTGLTVAVASMFFHNYLFNKKNSCIRLLRKTVKSWSTFIIG